MSVGAHSSQMSVLVILQLLQLPPDADSVLLLH